MNDLEKAARMALEALEDYHEEYPPLYKIGHMENIITALRQALEQPAEQEPLAWYRYETVYEYRNQLARCTKDCIGAFPVYTSPQRKPWAGLTQQDIDIAFDDTQEGGGFDDFARAIEAKLKEKNT